MSGGVDERRRRPRGRPKVVEHREPGHGRPLTSTSATAPQTTRCILEAARDILERCGLRAMTMAAVARGAHVDPKTVVYHFRDRAGLLEAVVDFLYHDTFADFAQAARSIADPELRWAELLRTIRSFAGDPQVSRAYFAVLTEALFDDALRERIGRLMIGSMREATPLIYGESARDATASGQLPTLDLLLQAAIDGIELHHAICSEEYPLGDVLDLLERLAMDERRRQIDALSDGA